MYIIYKQDTTSGVRKMVNLVNCEVFANFLFANYFNFRNTGK